MLYIYIIYIYSYLQMFVLCVFFVCFWYAPKNNLHRPPTLHLQELVEPTVQKMTVLASEAAKTVGDGWRLTPKRVGCLKGDL